MAQQDTELHKNISKALALKVDELDAHVCSALNQATHRALLEAEKPVLSRAFSRIFVIDRTNRLAAMALSMFLVLGITTVVFNTPETKTNNPMPIENKTAIINDDSNDPMKITTTIDLDAISEGEDLDLFENMELYQWLDSEFGSA